MSLASPGSLSPLGTGSSLEENRPLSGGPGGTSREEALACYGELLRTLRSRHWKRRLGAQAHRLREARALEVFVQEVLTLGEERSLRPLRRLRERLEVLARKRLARLTRQGGASMEEVLGRLEALVGEPRPQPPGQDEHVLLHGTQGWRHLLAWPGTWVFALLALINRQGLERLGYPGPLLVVGGGLFLYYHLRCTGRFWLTSKRLMWQPRFGEPVQVSLASISPGDIAALPAWGEVRVHGDRSVTVRHAGLAGRLAALLHLHRRSFLLGPEGGTARVEELAVLPAWRAPERASRGQRAEQGVAVLRPGYAAFLPAHRHAEVFRSLAGPGASQAEGEMTVELLVEQLRLLPEAEFDARLAQVVSACGGELWPSDEVRPGEASGDGRRLRLGARGVDMELRAEAAQVVSRDRILRHWTA